MSIGQPFGLKAAVLTICVVLASAAEMQAEGHYEKFAMVTNMINEWSWTVMLLPVLAAVVQLIKIRKGKGAGA